DERSAAALAPLLPDLAARAGRVLLVGAGNTGVEVSTELAERFPDLRITVATRRSFATNLSDGAQRHIRKAFSRLGIALIENAEVTRLDEGQAMTAAGPIANWFREFFVGFLLLTIRLQRTMPWVFSWPGKNKMRGLAWTERSTHEAAHADG